MRPSKREEFESILLSLYPVLDQHLYKALDAMIEEAEEYGYDEGYDEGYESGTEEADDLRDEDALEGKVKDALLARYYYLKYGGEWQREPLPSDEFASPADNYAEGFLDAMNILGVKL